MKRLITIALGAMLVAYSYQKALAIDLFYTLWWLDIAFHFLTSLLVGMVFLSIVRQFHSYRSRGIWWYAGAVLTCILIVGAVWEVFEFFNHLTLVTSALVFDTVSDVLANIAGALSAVVIFGRHD